MEPGFFINWTKIQAGTLLLLPKENEQRKELWSILKWAEELFYEAS